MNAISNHLINETSPYLLQHAYNPVNWYPWGPEALEISKREDKPILVSIGYSACHWCHVMEKESFENEEIATLMNKNFINIKIDREERPDLDQIYMDAVQAMSGSGGWPLNVFLTPEAKPFYGGTYYPPVKAFNRPSWKDILTSVKRIFDEQRDEVNDKARELTDFINRGIPITDSFQNLDDNPSLLSNEQQEQIFKSIMKQADLTWGGFGNAPKFPQTHTINTLLTYYFHTKNSSALEHACLSLNKMIAGGIYDQIGGGFSRYSTDKEWLAPHFEKMLYDNALLINTISDAYKITKNEIYRETVKETIDFLIRELKNDQGGFYAAIDADSEGVEGKYYVWDYQELIQLLGNSAKTFCDFFDISANGNWEGKNILRRLHEPEVFATNIDISVEDLNHIIKEGKDILFREREKRIRPSTDDKIILGWNALLIIAFCNAANAFSNNNYLAEAEECYLFLIDKFRINVKEIAMYHNYKNHIAKNYAFLDDYAFLIQACLKLQETTSQSKYLEDARLLTEFVLANFSSDDLFYYTHKNQSDVIIRKKEIYDGALPSANSVMSSNLYYLSIIYDNPDWRSLSISNANKLLNVAQSYPTSFGIWNCFLINLSNSMKEVAITGSNFKSFRDAVLQHYIPALIIQCSNDNNEEKYPLIKNRIDKDNKTVVYICENYNCINPVFDIKDVLTYLLK